MYDTGVSGGIPFIITEHLAGETLRVRLANGLLSQRKASEIATQIARGLAAAHEKGIVHRDLKPDNIFILPDGHVKLLDFGLARPAVTASGATETVAAITDPGSVMGTIGYMAPEQVRGQAADTRTDLFAFGLILYEMLTGRRAYQRETPAETMTAILKEDPPEMTGLRPDLSPALDRIVRHCVEKSPSERFQSARDIAFALEALSGSGTATSSPQVAAAARVPRGWIHPVLWSASIVVAAAAGVAGARLMRPPESQVSYERKTFDVHPIFNARFLPDGKSIAYSAMNAELQTELFVLHDGRVAPERIAEPGTHLLSVSSKGELAVLTGARYILHRLFTGTLARMMPGGAPRPWMDNVREADWAPNGESIAVVHDLGNGHDQLEFPAGTPLYEVTGYLSDPRVSRDGQRVAFVEHRFRFDDRGFVKVVDRNKKVTTLTGEMWGIEGLAWSADGTQIFFSGSRGTRRGSVNYEPHVVAAAAGPTSARLALPTMSDVIVQDVAPDGRWLIDRREDRDGVVVKFAETTVEQDVQWLDNPNRGVLSRDGTVLAFSDQAAGSGSDYGAMLLTSTSLAPVRLGDGAPRTLGISPDLKWVVALVPSTAQDVVYPTGTGEPKLLKVPSGTFKFAGWFSDSVHVLVCAAPPTNGCAKYSILGGPPTPVADDATWNAMMMDDNSAMFADAKGKWWLTRPGGSRIEARPPDVAILGLAGGTSVYVARPTSRWESSIEKYDVATANSSPLMKIPAPHDAGLVSVVITSISGTPDRLAYSYAYRRIQSTLEIATGIRR
ncbi:MAG: protein kinase domain-containing protein [Vicinamibacterales bacterium]